MEFELRPVHLRPSLEEQLRQACVLMHQDLAQGCQRAATILREAQPGDIAEGKILFVPSRLATFSSKSGGTEPYMFLAGMLQMLHDAQRLGATITEENKQSVENILEWGTAPGCFPALAYMLEHLGGARLLREASEGQYLVHAADDGSLEAIDLLLGHGADINLPYGGFGTPLMAACGRGHLRAAKHLLEQGADVNATDGMTGKTALFDLRQCSVALLELLLMHGADWTVVDDRGDTPLSRAQLTRNAASELLLAHAEQHALDQSTASVGKRTARPRI